MAYIGSRPDNVISRNAQNEYNYTATGGQTTFTGADSNNNTLSYTPGNIEVYFNGARLEESDFTATNGTSIVLANAAVVNDELSIVAMRVFEVGSISNFNTSDLAEGSNLYFTNARADARIAAADTDDLSEGSTNLYFTNARVASYLSSNDFDTATNIVASITDSAPTTLDTLNELAAALGDDANFATTTTNSIATKLPLAGGTLTGDLIINTSSNGILKLQEGGNDKGYIGAGGGGLYIKNLAGDVIFRNSSDADTIRIKDNGDVGIGFAAPTAQLDVRRGDADGKIAEFHQNTGYGIDIGSSQSVAYISSGYNQRLDFKTDPTSGQTERMSILANGNVGIGTSSPTHTLHTKAAASGVFIQREIASNAATLSEFNSNRSLIIKNRDSGSFLMFGGNGSRTDIQASDGAGSPTAKTIALNPFGGRVGIGIVAPDAPLHIEDSTSSAYGGIRVVGAGTGSGSTNVRQIADFGRTSSGSDSGVWLGGRTDETTAVIGAKTASGNIAFEVYQSGWQERMRIKNNGNVGIGDTNPAEKFTIKGDGARMTISSNDYEVAMLGRRGSTAPNWDRGYLRMKYDGANTVVLDTGGVSYLNGGNVGIGTGSPASTLDVKGDFRITRNVAVGHASEGNWNFNISMESASYYGSLYLIPSVSTGELSVMGDKLRVTQSSGVQIISDTGNSTSSDNVAIKYRGTAGGHKSGYLFKDKRDAVNAAVKNNLLDDGVGTTAASLEFYTSNGGTLTKQMNIDRYGYIDTTNPRFSVGAAPNARTGKTGIRVGRTIINWFNYGRNDGHDYLHIKTNLTNIVGSNPQATMSSFHIRGYTYGTETIDSILGFHNWNGTYYSTAYRNNGSRTVVSGSYAPYRSSDNKVVIVLNIGNNYPGISIDYMQNFEYTWRDVEVSAYSKSASTSGVY